MGQACSSTEKYDKNLRSKHFSGTRAAPVTDTRGTQDEYANAVDVWCDFQDPLQDKNPNRHSA